MATVHTSLPLSGSTTYKAIKVVATATPGTLIHTAVAGTTNTDQIRILAVNSSAAAVKLTIEWGGVAAPDDLIEKTIPAEDGLYFVIPSNKLNNGLVVGAFASSANVVMIHGDVIRETV